MKNHSLKTRIIPVLLLKDGILVRSRKFNFYQTTGDPFLQVERFNSWNVDELIYLNISRTESFDAAKSVSVIGATSGSKQVFENPPKDMFEFVSFLSKRCFMPLAYGGGIKNIEQVGKLLQSGADKVVVNSAAHSNPKLITEIARSFGSQCAVVSVDCKKTDIGHEVFVEGGKVGTGIVVSEWIKRVTDLGTGEVLVNSIDRDGMGNGYDLDLLRPLKKTTKIPLIACGGAGKIDHFNQALTEVQPDALAAANIFHFIEHSYHHVKTDLLTKGANVRP